MFKFFSDGGASGRRRLELRIGELRRSFEVSALTGRVIEVKEDENSKVLP